MLFSTIRAASTSANEKRGLRPPLFFALYRNHLPACVLVVIAILAIGLFRGNLEDLWGAISEGINSLTVPQ